MTDPAAVGRGRGQRRTGRGRLALLRRYEPILRFTHGELFFPMPASGTSRRCGPAGRPDAATSCASSSPPAS